VADLDLFAADRKSDRKFFSIADVTRRARTLVEAGLGKLWVKGEVSGLKSYRSGHWYFTLRDESAQVRCVMWRSDTEGVKERPGDGDEVFAQVQPTVWEEKGEFRLTVRQILSTTIEGKWQAQLEEARKALEKDGLLDQSRKRALPEMPRRVVVVTSMDGAVLRDIVSVFQRRWPVEILVVPSLVQGGGAALNLCKALALVNRLDDVDLAIIARGGGSREDLWAFNMESVARAVAAVRIPIISAIGHETDVSLTDMVADFRAPTPSAAAEVAVPDRAIVAERVDDLGMRLAGGLNRWTTWGHERIERTSDRLDGVMKAFVYDRERRLADLRGSFLSASERVVKDREVVLGELAAALNALSPLKVLERGYSAARDEQGKTLKLVDDFTDNSVFNLTVSDGVVRSRVERK
jgi:exodeoxyribonuclease VII large subunit